MQLRPRPTPRTRFPPRPTPRGRATPRPTPRTRFPHRPTLRGRDTPRPVSRGGPRLVRPPGVGFRLARLPGRDFRLVRSLGIRSATRPKQWSQGRTRTASTTTTWKRTPGSTSRTCPDVTGGRIGPCWETHVVHRVNRPVLCCQLPT